MDIKKSSFEKLASPEQLNQRLCVVTFRSWIALFTFGIIILSILLWSIWGSIPVIIEGRALVFDPDRTVLVRSQVAGTVSNVFVKPGSQVQKGALLLTLENSELDAEILEKERFVTSLEEWIRSHSHSEESDMQLLNERAKLQTLLLSKEKEKIIAPQSGTVVNINFSQNVITAGTALVWMEGLKDKGFSEKQEIHALFPFETGELIKEGMRAEVALASVNKEEYGLLIGRVVKVFPYFTSFEEGPFRFLPSEELRAYLTKGAATGGVVVKIEPDVDSQTQTGYRWSSKKGPPFAIKEGSVGTAKIVLSERKPISYLIPEMKEK